MNISKAARSAGLPVKTVRYYANIGLVTPGTRNQAGYRQYDEDTVGRLAFVRRCRRFGFSIDECRELLELLEDNTRSSADVKQIAIKRLDEIEQRQKELQLLHDQLSSLVGSCRGDRKPDCAIINALYTEGSNA